MTNDKNPTHASASKSASRISLSWPILGLLLVGLNLRAGISAVPPIYPWIVKDFAITAANLSVLGMLPMIAYACFGICTRALIHRIGIERSLIAAMALVFAGDLARSALSDQFWAFAFFSFICFGGMGIANVALPPMIKRYFPNRIGPMTSFYIVLTVISASLPSLIAVPVTDLVGWRIYVGAWSALALIAIVPWVRLSVGPAAKNVTPTERQATYPAWRWPVSWAIALIFGVGAFNMFAVIAWLPKMLVATAGVSAMTAGAFLSLYNFVGLPHSLILPTLLTRMRRPIWAIAFATACGFVGPLGLTFDPHHYWLWVVPTGLGAMNIPIGLILINLRTRTEQGAASLSAFVQGAGYLFGAFGPVSIGLLYSWTGGWMWPNVCMAIVALSAMVAGAFAVRSVVLED